MAAKNSLQQLADHGQAFWYDNMRRLFLRDGTLQKLIDQDDLRGVTANPTIFEHAIASGTDYDASIRTLVMQGSDANTVYERLATDDVRAACDLLRPVYDRTSGTDGFVSLEVSPTLARDTEGTIAEVRRFWKIVDRPNLMVKIPATREGLPAIERMLSEGININITLIFAIERYVEVAHAYINALRGRIDRGLSVDRIASVASFFVSRVDTKVDALLDEKIAGATSDGARRELESLKGKAAIANAKIAYEDFQQLFYGQEFAALRDHGPRVQRPLWASTSTKNPAYRDVMYVEELIGADTVDTMPPQTIDAFHDHGIVRDTLSAGIDEAHVDMDHLRGVGVDIARVTKELEDEGVESFAKSFETLLHEINVKRDAFLADCSAHASAALGKLQQRVDKALAKAQRDQIATRIWEKDARVWNAHAAKNDPEYSGWLGWLDAPRASLQALGELSSLVDEVRKEGITHVVVLGMGGSSLAPEVFHRVFGVVPGYPTLHVLDSTDPANVLALDRAIDLKRSLFIVSSKSGTTTEPNDFFAYFWDRVQNVGVREPGRQFVAITDAGTPLQKLGVERGFRRVFTNDPTIGGRYSALSLFGIVPAALMGVDVGALFEGARAMAERCASNDPNENPGLWLGTHLGELTVAGREKVTLLFSPSLESLGLWIEQLLAESTGKQGKGLIPIAGEGAGTPEVSGDDRVFVNTSVTSDHHLALDQRLLALEQAGQPVLRIQVQSALDIGGEFFRWEFATAVAGALLGINPFDQPNVQESKDNTKRVLAAFEAKGRLPEPWAQEYAGGIAVAGDGKRAISSDARENQGALVHRLAAFLEQVKPGDYVAFMAWLPYGDAIDRELNAGRLRIRDMLKVATTLGYGPRFLHSTGQLHKGGPSSGVYVQITATPKEDVHVPGRPYTFRVLEEAQALGDLQALEKHGRRVIRLHIEGELLPALTALMGMQQTSVAG